jgi:hypothetical protein
MDGGAYIGGQSYIGGLKTSTGSVDFILGRSTTPNVAYSYNATGQAPFNWRYFTDYWGMEWNFQGTAYNGVISESNTSITFGKPGSLSVHASSFFCNGLYASTNLDPNGARMFGYSSAAPAKGAFGAGELTLNKGGGSIQGWWNKTQGLWA